MRDILLSVDLDFFTPEDPMWMWDHTEAFRPPLADIIWQSRAAHAMAIGMDLVDVTGTSRADFLPRKLIPVLRGLGWTFTQECPLTVSDSHAYALHAFLPFLPEDVRIVNLDAHSDMGYVSREEMKARVSRGSVQCEDWLWFARCLAQDAEIVQVYPGWKEDRETDQELHWMNEDDIGAGIFSEEMMRETAGRVVAIHVARSCAWVPPWHDAEMIGAILEVGDDLGTGISAFEEDALRRRHFDVEQMQIVSQRMKCMVEHARQDTESEG